MTRVLVMSAWWRVALAVAGQGVRFKAAPSMNFFVTSKGLGDGANLGGIAGADYHCQQLAAAAGSQRTFYAYLSTRPANGTTTLHGKDRIGKGPFYNAKGVMIAKDVADLHGAAAGFNKESALTEKGEMVERHDIITGRSPTAPPTPTAWTTRATATRATGRPGRCSSGTRTGAAARRGFPRIRARAAARRTWPAPAGRGSSIASRLTSDPAYEVTHMKIRASVRRWLFVLARRRPVRAGAVPRITASRVSIRTTKPIELKGTVAEYRWRNPHVLFFWDVKDENGKVVRWVGEFASVPSTHRARHDQGHLQGGRGRDGDRRPGDGGNAGRCSCARSSRPTAPSSEAPRSEFR